ncbi:MAG TPA: M20 family metallo-hydrolase [Deltaproteobacteria bacterium]|jgi:succinyl-diaminopimelate desuccinylase|nr:M20 family metallo-hydrolase [Deltaproteobacteria bacterium]
MIKNETFQQIIYRIDAFRDDMIKLQVDLTAFPALSPENGGDGEYDKALFLKSYLRENGFEDVMEIDAPDDRVASGVRPTIVTKLPGKNPDKTVWILTHTDIVPPGELKLWHEDPYRACVKEGKIFGRGTEDNQQDLVSSIFSAKAILDEGIVPESSIGLIFVADEETGSDLGLGYVIEHYEHLFRKSDIIIVPDFGIEDGTAIEIAEKSILWLRIETKGRQCHASKPSLGNNAFVAASYLVVLLRELYDYFDAADPAYSPPESTFEPTKKNANIPNINTIPGDDVFFVDCRVLPAYDLFDVKRKIRHMADSIEQQFKVTIDITSVQEAQAPPPTEKDAPVVLALKRAIREIYGVDARPMGIGGGTVAAIFRKKGYPVAVWSKLGMTAHQPNEHCLIDNMIGNAKVYAHLFMQHE